MNTLIIEKQPHSAYCGIKLSCHQGSEFARRKKRDEFVRMKAKLETLRLHLSQEKKGRNQ